jgi:hypothetical protein
MAWALILKIKKNSLKFKKLKKLIFYWENGAC